MSGFRLGQQSESMIDVGRLILHGCDKLLECSSRVHIALAWTLHPPPTGFTYNTHMRTQAEAAGKAPHRPSPLVIHKFYTRCAPCPVAPDSPWHRLLRSAPSSPPHNSPSSTLFSSTLSSSLSSLLLPLSSYCPSIPLFPPIPPYFPAPSTLSLFS